MGKLLEKLERYFENTPEELLEKDFGELAFLNEIGPDVLEYAGMFRKNNHVEASRFCTTGKKHDGKKHERASYQDLHC
ncbi:MAG: recombinase [Segatella maculosa]